MAFNVNDFRQRITGDGARPNLFEVRMNFPSFANISGVDDKFKFMCNTAQLPGSTIGVAPVFYFGREVKLAGNRTYPEWTVNVINDEDFIIRNAMERWMNGINDPELNIRDPNASVVDLGYGVDADVIQYSKMGFDIKSYKFYGMFPIDIAPIELSWSANDQVEEFAITFAVQYWVADDAASELNNAVGAVGRVLNQLPRSI